MIRDLYDYLLDAFDGDKEEFKVALRDWEAMLENDKNEYEKVYDEEIGDYIIRVKEKDGDE